MKRDRPLPVKLGVVPVHRLAAALPSEIGNDPAATRHAWQLGSLGDKWDLHYNWGLRSIELDAAALANHRLVIGALKARLRDGTLVSIPEDGSLAKVRLTRKKAGQSKE
jgi:hypothetical protein